MHRGEAKTGVLLVNLGSPDAVDNKSVKKYLKQFLSDDRVIHPDAMPRWLWWILLNGIILNSRPRKSAKLYQKVWDTFGKGSPLVVISKKITQALNVEFQGQNVECALAMRYANPSIQKSIDELLEKKVGKIIVLPLFPQYSKTTTESIFDEIKKFKDTPIEHLIKDYHNHPAYIKAIKNSILNYWNKYGKADKLIISYHGLPQKYVDKGDVYPQQCEQTTKLLVESLNLSKDEYLHCYQSRFGKQIWLQPYLDETLKSLPTQGIKKIQIICPGFAADCLETLEEIDCENKSYFLQAGGLNYNYIPALNDSIEHILCLKNIIKENIIH